MDDEATRNDGGTTAPGGEVSPGAPERFCTSCGGPVHARDAFCAGCGHAIGSPTEVAAVPAGVANPAPVPPAPQRVEAVASTPPPAPPSPPPAGAGGGASRPGWVVPAIAGFAAVAALALVGAVVLSLGGEEADAPTTPAANSYLPRIDRDYTLLTRSATTTGNALSTAAGAEDVRRVNGAARRQLQVVSNAYTNLAKLAVSDQERPAQTALVRAAGLQRRYLALLVRTTSAAPGAGLRQVPALERAGRETVGAYRRFLTLAPGAATTITSAGLVDLGGLRSALVAGRDARSASAAPNPNREPEVSAGTAGFVSPARTTVCGAVGGSVICRAASGTLALDQGGPAYFANGDPGSGHGVLQYGFVWRSGSISCSIDRQLGTICRNGFGAFRIRAQDLDVNW